MKFLKEADKIALYERALTNVDLLFETPESASVKSNGVGEVRLQNHTTGATFASILKQAAEESYFGGTGDWSPYADRTSLVARNCGLISLEGFPTNMPDLRTVDLGGNDFKSLKGIWQDFDGELLVTNCAKLTSLKYCPPNVSELHLDDCPSLKDFEGAPEQIGTFSAERLKGLKSTAGIPKHVESLWLSSENDVKLEGVVESCGHMTIDFPLTNLTNFHKVFKKVRDITIYGNKLTSSILSLMLIKDLASVIVLDCGDVLSDAIEIVNNHLPNHTGMEGLLKCQDALLDAGLDQYAKL